MNTLRQSAERGTTVLEWLDSKHTFSFADYHDPRHMHFGVLRVINEDIVQPGQGFGFHPHRDMEILTYIVSGALEHKDNMGNTSVIRRGEVQRMSAGTGVMHSEFNHSQNEPVHLLQIWIMPEQRGITPSYEQSQFTFPANALTVVANQDGSNGALTVHQRVRLAIGFIEKGKTLSYKPEFGSAWVQVISGDVSVEDTSAQAGDGVSIEGIESFGITAKSNCEILVFDLATA